MTSTRSATQGTSASAEFDALLAEATDIVGRIQDQLANGEWPAGIHWGHVGDMAHYTEALREISDAMFKEGEHAV